MVYVKPGLGECELLVENCACVYSVRTVDINSGKEAEAFLLFTCDDCTSEEAKHRVYAAYSSGRGYGLLDQARPRWN